MLTSNQYDKDALTVAPVPDEGEDWQARLDVLHLECNVNGTLQAQGTLWMSILSAHILEAQAKQTGVDKHPMHVHRDIGAVVSYACMTYILLW